MSAMAFNLFPCGWWLRNTAGEDEYQCVVGKTVASIEEVMRDHEDHAYINFTDGSRFRLESSEWLRLYVDPPRFIGGLRHCEDDRLSEALRKVVEAAGRCAVCGSEDDLEHQNKPHVFIENELVEVFQSAMYGMVK